MLLLGVVAFGWLGQFLGGLVGGRIRRRVGQTSLRRVDSVLGAVVVTLAASLIIWFLGGALRTAGNPALSKAMAESKVLQVVNSVVPEETGQVFAGFRGFLSSQGFPQVFGGLAPEPITPVPAPDTAVARSQAIRAAGRSVVKVTTQSQSCQRGQEGTGWVLSPGLIVTNAHVVAGADEVRVQGGDQTLRARVVVFDPRRDLAVLSVPGLPAATAPARWRAPARRLRCRPGLPARRSLPRRVGPGAGHARRPRTRHLRQRACLREIYSLAAIVQPGNSGGPLLDTNGRVVGVIFAKSLEDNATGYALTLAEAKPVLEGGRVRRAEVATGACVAG